MLKLRININRMASISILENQYLLSRKILENFEVIDDNRNRLNNFENIAFAEVQYKSVA